IREEIPALDPASVIREVQKTLTEQTGSLTELGKAYQYTDHSLATSQPAVAQDLREVLISGLHRIEAFQSNTQETVVRILQGLGIGDTLAEGKFGLGYSAIGGNSYAFPAADGLIDEGCLEFLVKPTWNPLLDQAYRVLATLVGYQPAETDLGKDAKLPFCSIRVIKDTRRGLVLEVQGYDGLSESVDCPIDTWEANSWHHVAVNWSKEKGDANLYVDGRFIGSTGSGMDRRSSSGYEDFGMMEGGLPRGMYTSRRSSRSASGRSTVRVLSTISLLEVLYLGADHEGLNPADAVFDDLRVSNKQRTSFTFDKPSVADDTTVLLRDFEQEYIPADEAELMKTLSAMRHKMVYAEDSHYNQQIRDRYAREYEVLRRSLGIDVKKVEEERAGNGVYVLEELFLADYLRKHLPSSFTLDYLVQLLAFKIPEKDVLEDLVAYLDIAEWIAKKAVDQKVQVLSEVRCLGSSTEQNDEAVWIEFEKVVKELEAKYPPSERQAGVMGAMGMSPEMMMMMDPAAMAEMQMMMGAEMGIDGMPYGAGARGGGDPAQRAKMDEINKLNRYLESYQKGEVSPDFALERKAQEGQGGVGNVYIKRIARAFFKSNVEQFAGFLYDLEHGDYLVTVDKLNVTSNEKETLECSAKIDFHFLAPTEITDEQVSGTPDSATGEVPVAPAAS
ncbi:MAG TPA: hypothetical protein PKH07_01525, partial [bacterium]|nr:hypothetical protein [bacterium]